MAACALLTCGAAALQAQNFPSRAVRIVIPFAPGGGTHLGVALFKSAAGLDLVHIPYKGSGPAAAAVLAGHVVMTFASPSATVQHVAAGKLRALAVTGDKRNGAMAKVPQLPDIRQRLMGLGFEPIAGTPEDGVTYVCEAVAKWARVVAQAKIRSE